MHKFHYFSKVAATAALAFQGIYYSVAQPGPMDLANGVVAGLAVYAIWFANERTK